jgi:hypothetical protein
VAPINFVANQFLRLSRFFGARLQSAFLHGPGETIRDKQTSRQAAGKPTRQAPSKIKGGRVLRAMRSGFRLKAPGALRLTLSKRLNLPVTIPRGITRSHPEHGS